MQIIIDFNEKKTGGFIVLHKRHMAIALAVAVAVLFVIIYGVAHQVARYWVAGKSPIIADIIREEVITINEDRRRLWGVSIDTLEQDIANFNARLIDLTQQGEVFTDYLGLSADKVIAVSDVTGLCNAIETTSVESLEESTARLSGVLFQQNATLDKLEKRYAVLTEQGVHDTVLKKTIPTNTPIIGKNWVASRYGYRRDPFTGRQAFHAGTDYAARSGTPVIAGASGVVIYAGRLGNYGNAVHLYHGDKISSLYGHLKNFNVELFEYVEQGEVIGSVGSTGRSTGPHLHYEVRVDKKSRPLNKTLKNLRAARNLL